MVREIEEPVEVDSDEKDGDDAIKVNDKRKEKHTAIELRSAIETLMDYSFFIKPEEAQPCTMKISALVENKLSKKLKQASIKGYFGWNL